MNTLSHLTILDLTHMLSGPYAGMLLADLGAHTIKIEPPEGEGTRKLLADSPDYSVDGMGAYFLTLNRNKQSVCIDLKSVQGLALFYELVKTADVVLNNFARGVPERLKIDHATLAAINPRIITCSITGFGETGPDPDRPAFDIVAQGMGGGMSITGEEGGAPMRAGIPIGDLGGGLFASIGVLSALSARSVSGKGQHVDISMQDCQLSLLNYMATMHLMSGIVPGPMGNGHFVHVPYNTFRTRTRWIIVACLGDAFFTNLANMFGDERLQNPEYATQPGRWAHRHDINQFVQENFDRDDCENWLAKLKEFRIPAAPVNDFAHALGDPQALARQMVVDVPLASGGSVKQPGNPVKLSAGGAARYTAPPPLGHDTASVLRERLGLADDALAELARLGIIRLPAAG
ncbi:MAG: CoA transferase [Moraxellaceae bacterium]|nr:CoA transferase [Moraxellaceae bacterium]